MSRSLPWVSEEEEEGKITPNVTYFFEMSIEFYNTGWYYSS